MSRIVAPTHKRELSHFVESNDGRLFFVDTAAMYYGGYETMVFEIDHGAVVWDDLYRKWSADDINARAAHFDACVHIEEYT